MLYICAKFREIILNGRSIKVIERTRFLYGKLQRGRMGTRTDTQNFGGITYYPPLFVAGQNKKEVQRPTSTLIIRRRDVGFKSHSKDRIRGIEPVTSSS